MSAIIRHVFLTLFMLFMIAVVVRVAVPYRKTLLQKEEKQVRQAAIIALFNSVEASTNKFLSLEELRLVTGPKGDVIDVSAYIYNSNAVAPGVRKEHRIVLAEKTSRFPRSGLFYAVDEQGSVVAWRLTEYTNLLQKNGISAAQ